MSALSGYLMRLICAAIVCALIGSVAGRSQSLRRLIAGIFLTLTALSPVEDLELPDLDLNRLQADAQAAVRDGTEQADEMRADIISEACQAYIWNKASELGLELEIRLELDGEGLPRSVELTGQASPLERRQLTQTIVRDLGLGREDVTWKDPYQSSA